ncbi:MAG: hypothetical protein JNG84_05305 [Archangium sp.]|nr:hypothetical protein [Archangium sp.]
MAPTPVQEFWNWFSKNHGDFGEQFENRALIEQLDAWVTTLGPYVWEIGPGLTEANALVISPGGDPELLEETKRIVALAPALEGWEFHSTKPQKAWNLTFEILTDMFQLEVKAHDWRYVLLRYPDGKFEIILRAPELMGLEPDTRTTAAEILLDGMLGEAMRMQFIDVIDVVGEYEAAHAQKNNAIEHLPAHLAKLTA